MGSTWHQKCGWKADDYFDDSKVIALCRAIEANDIAEIDRLVAAGADVKAKGKGNMTPLLWAYPDNKLDRFKRLLEHGANPNVAIESDLNTHGGMRPGDSVTHLACKTSFPGYFEAVFSHGGDPNLIRNGIIPNETPLFTLIKGRAPSKLAGVKVLIAKGADLNHINGAGFTPAMTAVGWGNQFDIALELLNGGADPKIFRPTENAKLVHLVLGKEHDQKVGWTPQQRADHGKLVEWLKQHGESFDDAKADLNRWDSWSQTTGEYSRNMAAEVAARKAKEAREKPAPQGHKDDDK
jgi:hypothetical protein